MITGICKQRCQICLEMLSLSLLTATTILAGDWPQFRGLRGDGIAINESLADGWPVDGPPVLWVREIGQGYSSFVIANSRAYTLTQSLYEQSLVCLDVATGETIWSYRYGWPYDGGGLYPGPRSTPTVYDGHVYYVAPNGDVGCVTAETGTLVWSCNPKEQYRGRGTDFGVAASPVVIDGKVIIPVGGPQASLVALDALTGKTVWTCGELPASYATPIVVTFAGRPIVIAPLENSLLCADASTGKKLWELDLSSGYDEHSAAPLYREPFLFLARPFRSGGTCYRLIAEGEPPGCRVERVWDTLKMSNDVASSVLVGEQIYGFDLKDIQSRLHRPSRGEFRCLDWADGTVRWSSDELGHANIIVADDKALLFNDRGELRLCRFSAEGMETLSTATLFPDEVIWTSPALSDGRVILRTHQQAVCLDVGRQRQPKSTTTTIAEIPQPVRFNPTWLLGGEREFPAATPEIVELQHWYHWMLAGWATSWLLGMQLPRLASRVSTETREQVYWGLMVVIGALGSAALNLNDDQYIFTWPLAIWALFLGSYGYTLRALQSPPPPWAITKARLSLLLFLLGCGLYFHLCRWLGIAIEWCFLTGFAAAVPVLLIGDFVRRRSLSAQAWPIAVRDGLAFSAYYWGCVGFMQWWLPVGS